MNIQTDLTLSEARDRRDLLPDVISYRVMCAGNYVCLRDGADDGVDLARARIVVDMLTGDVAYRIEAREGGADPFAATVLAALIGVTVNYEPLPLQPALSA